MKCEEYRELFSDFIDSELSEEQTENFRNHLQICEVCREELEKFRQSQTLLKLIPKKEAPPELWRTIETKVRLIEGESIFFFQSLRILERLRLEEKPSSLTHIYGMSFGMPRWG